MGGIANKPAIESKDIFSEAVRANALAIPDKVALTFEGRDTTYAELEDAANQVAHGLAALGVGRADRIAILDKNTDRFFEIWLGTSKLGAVLVPVNARLAALEVEFIINDSDTKVLFIGAEFVDVIDQIRSRLSNVKKIIVVNEEYENWRQAWPVANMQYPASADDVCLQLYTSGTTGHPKGVQLVNSSVVAGETLEAWGGWTSADTALLAMPSFHIAGCGVGNLGLIAGMRIVVAREFVPAKIIELIEKERITVTFLVPSMIMFLLDDARIASADLSSIRRIVYGGSPIPVKLLQRAVARFSTAGFLQVYGLTETTGGITVLSPEDHKDPEATRMRSCGRPISGVELRISGTDGNPVAQGEVGEIACRTVKNMKGYWHRDEETKKTLRGDWLYTGDAGYLDAEGFLYIHDRVKDMIVSGGENIYPAEVESAIFGHSAIAEVAVIGVPDERWGEAVKAVVVLKPGNVADAAEILAYTRERLASYKVPKSVDFVQTLPRNSTGKVLKRELREVYWAGYERRVN